MVSSVFNPRGFACLVIITIAVVSFSGCGGSQGPAFLWTSESIPSPSSTPYQIQAQSSASQDFQSVTIRGNVKSNDTQLAAEVAALQDSGGFSNLPVVVKRVTLANDTDSQVVYTDANGQFVASFDTRSLSKESFQITLLKVNPNMVDPNSNTTVDVDLTGSWDGALIIDTFSGACDKIPRDGNIKDIPVAVSQSGKSFSVKLGNPLNFDNLTATVGQGLSVSGKGSAPLTPTLAEAIGCFETMQYQFTGTLDSTSQKVTFDVSFQAALSGTIAHCSAPAQGVCDVTGRLTGTRVRL